MYKFKFRIVNTETDEVFMTDWTTFDADRVDEFGGCETVDIHVASALRKLRRVHEQQERALYADGMNWRG